MNRIDKKFKELKKLNKKAFIVYLTVGYPNINTTEKLIMELSKSGVDMFELGIPFSDPLADGPIIQEASADALKHQINLEKVFGLTKRLRSKLDIPLLAMGYFNPILDYGIDKFAKKAKQSGLDAIIVPDLPIDESGILKKALLKNGIYLINFIAPTTDKKRTERILSQSKGFIYYVSLTGVTGTRDSLPDDVVKKVKGLKKIAKIPVCVGFGVSKRSQFKQVAAFSDGVIVGSAIIKKIKENKSNKNLVSKIASFAKNLLP